MTRALASARVPHTGLAESSGSLGLPDVPELETVASQLGGTTRTRVWWAGPATSRVDVLTPTGEQGIYVAGVGGGEGTELAVGPSSGTTSGPA